MSDAGEGSGANVTLPPAEKRPRNGLSVSPQKRAEPLLDVAGGCRLKCNGELGPDSKAIQCDLCGSWIRAGCENISDEVYDNINAVLGSVNSDLRPNLTPTN